jgi:hypothetical protein
MRCREKPRNPKPTGLMWAWVMLSGVFAVRLEAAQGDFESWTVYRNFAESAT